MNAFNDGAHTVLYTSGVGTGKSFVFMGLAETLLTKDQKVLYIIPKYAIMENMKAYSDFSALSMQVDFETFNFFTDAKKGMEKLSKYDLIVIDEAHHLWSDMYGNVIVKCMEVLKEKLFLGLTATPERDIREDGHRKYVHTGDIFEAQVDGISNFEAIRLGLMPKFNYRIMLPEKDPHQLRKEYENTVNVQVEYTDCEKTLSDIVKNNERDKWIAYFSDKMKLHENEALIRKVFAGYDIYILYADLKNLNDVIEGVQKSEKAIVLSVDMLLEGVHLPGITGIILFRNVTSLVTFQQILGRVCSIGNKIEPVVIDASSSGPQMLAKLYSIGKEIKAQPPKTPSGNAKPILTLGIGSDKEWVGIEEFLKGYTSLGKSMVVEENVALAKEKYNALCGKVYETKEQWESDKLSFKVLKACASCFKAPLSSLITALNQKAA